MDRLSPIVFVLGFLCGLSATPSRVWACTPTCELIEDGWQRSQDSSCAKHNLHWSSAYSEVNVYLDFSSFAGINPDLYNANTQPWYEASVTFALERWNSYPATYPKLHYRGTRSQTEPNDRELVITMEGSHPYGRAMAQVGMGSDLPDYHFVPYKCVTSTGEYTRAKVIFYHTTGGYRNDWHPHLGRAPGLTSHEMSFPYVVLHEVGHTFGPSHTCYPLSSPEQGIPLCDCQLPLGLPSSDEESQALTGCDRTHTYDGSYAPYFAVHGPREIDAARLRSLGRGPAPLPLIHDASENAGVSWYRQVDNGPTSTTPGGATGNNSTGQYVMTYRKGNSSGGFSDRVATLRGDGVYWNWSTLQESTLGDQLGPSIASDGGSKILVAFTEQYGSSSDVTRWIDLLYSSDGGSTWVLILAPHSTVSRPSVSYTKVGSQGYWLLAFQTRTYRAIRVAVATDGIGGPSFPNGDDIVYNGKNTGAYGGISIACVGPDWGGASNSCQVAFISDGTNWTSSWFDTWTVAIVGGSIVSGHWNTTAGSLRYPSFYPDSVQPGITHNNSDGWWHVVGSHYAAARKTLTGTTWEPSGVLPSTPAWCSGVTMGQSSYWDEIVGYHLACPW